MAKLVKHKNYGVGGKENIFSYSVIVSKKIVKEAGFTGEEQLKVYAKDGKIIVEKEG